jgi:endonuclease YncB( thermonuclease family)
VIGAATAGLLFAAVGLSGDLFGRMSPDPRIISAAGSQVDVIDGDTLRLAGTVVRLSDLKTPPRGQPCTAGSDCGSRSIAALAALVRDRNVECRVVGHDTMGRPAARCDADGHDINNALVLAGWAQADNAVLTSAEMDARSHKRGIWQDN